MGGDHFSVLNAACYVNAGMCKVHGDHKCSTVPGITAVNLSR